MIIKNASASRIETFNMCTFKYFLIYHEKKKLKSNWGASHGTLLHDILEKYVNGADKDWMNRLYLGYAGQLKTEDKFGEIITLESPLVWAKPDDYANQKPHCDTCPFAQDGRCKISQERLDKLKGCPKKLFEASVRTLNNVFRRYSPTYDDSSKVLGTEYTINFTVPGTDTPLICILDLVIKRSDDIIEIVDYKFGKMTKNAQELRTDVQARICSYAARKEFIEDINKKGHKYKGIFLTFDYFSDAPATIALTENDDALTEKSLINAINKVKTTKYVSRLCGNSDPDTHWKCRTMCDPAVCRSLWKGTFQLDEQS